MLLPSSSSALLVDLYELTMAESYFRHRAAAQATFDLFVRNLPKNRSYLLFAGLEDILAYLKNLKFTQADLDYLKRLRIFSEDFLTYLGKLRFHGDVWAMPEGTVFFPSEPVVRVTGSLIETQIVESFLLNAVNLSTMIATKASRIVASAAGRRVYDFSLRRTHGADAALKAARASTIAGFCGTSNVLASRLYGIPAVGTMAHAFVMSFASELESFRVFFETFPNRCILLVDTYNTRQGVVNAIRAAQEFKAKGYALKGIRLDSGDIASLAKMSRSLLDAAGLRDVRIFASGDLDEYRIAGLIRRRAPVDDFGVGTKMGVSSDAPSLDVIYKICEVTGADGAFLPAMKLSAKKATLPGRKQVFRLHDKKGRIVRDIVGLEKEALGTPLLEKVVQAGEALHPVRSLADIRARVQKNLKALPKRLLALTPGASPYPVVLSAGLRRLMRQLRHEFCQRVKKS